MWTVIWTVAVVAAIVLLMVLVAVFGGKGHLNVERPQNHYLGEVEARSHPKGLRHSQVFHRRQRGRPTWSGLVHSST